MGNPFQPLKTIGLPLRRLGVAIVLAASAAGAADFAASPARIQTQTFRLSPGWNLIGFQVTPTNPEPAAVFATLPGFRSVWTFESATGRWQRHVSNSGSATDSAANAQTANELLRLPPIRPGRGYWLELEARVDSWTVTGVVPAGEDFPALTFDPGWHLIGVPVGATSVTNLEPVNLLSVLSAAGFDYDAVLTWETNAYRKLFRPRDESSPLSGLPADPPFPGFNFGADLQRGYWVHALTNASLRPRLVTTVRPDMDLPPRGNFPGREDLNVSGATSPEGLRSTETQDTIRFLPGEDVQSIGIANLGADGRGGGGILLWEVHWEPDSSPSTPEPWIRLYPSRDTAELRDANGRPLGDPTRLSGVTTIENDLVYLRLDRRNLGRGLHSGTVTVRSTVGDRTFRVIAEIPAVEGDFSGYAVIESVNGRRNPVPDVDLSITFYEDHRVPGLLRGLIDSSRAVMWPVDVPLVGHRIADEANAFLLSGGYAMPPGDQNGEPFDQWDQDDSAAGQDVDWLNDGHLDVRNPFPFPIQRTVVLEGTLVTGNPADGYVLKGRYRELVHGLSRAPIELLGSFHLERQAIRPFTGRRLTESDTGMEPVVLKRASPTLSIPSGQIRTNTLNVKTDLALHALQVELDFGSSLPHSNLIVTLRSPGPGGREVVLYHGTQAPIPANELRAVNFPRDRVPYEDLDPFIRHLPRTGAPNGTGLPWQLVIENRGSQPVTFPKWSLRLEGQPITEIHGRVLSGTAPLQGATVTLDGLPFSRSATTDSDGRFALPGMPLLPVNLSARIPGFAQEDPARAGLPELFTIPFARLPESDFTPLELSLRKRFNPLAGATPPLSGVAGFDAGSPAIPFDLPLQPIPLMAPAIVAGPIEALAGSTVTFAALGFEGSARWDFGDGTEAEGRPVAHAFARPGVYRVRVSGPTDGASPLATVTISMLPAPGNAPAMPGDLAGEPTGLPAGAASARYAGHVFQAFRTSGGVAYSLGPSEGFTLGETNTLGAALIGLMSLQHAYAASMDLDLAPHVPDTGSQSFDSDGFMPLRTEDANRQFGFHDEDFDYALPANLWKDTKTWSGTSEYPDLDSDLSPILWGNPLENPKINYAVRRITDRNGQEFQVSEDDRIYNPHPGTGTWGDLAPPHQTVTHLRLTCSLGAEILTATTPSTAVRVARDRRGLPEDPFAAPLQAAPGPLSRNLYYQLHFGPLSAD